MRRLATDKIIMGFIFLIFAAIVFIIVSIFHLSHASAHAHAHARRIRAFFFFFFFALPEILNSNEMRNAKMGPFRFQK